MSVSNLHGNGGQWLSESSGSLSHIADLDVRVEMCLRCWSITGSERVEVRICSGTVILQGAVATSAAKYQVAECCRHIPGVREVVDSLRVTRPRSVGSGGDTRISAQVRLGCEHFDKDRLS